jgi:hypothetical protein
MSTVSFHDLVAAYVVAADWATAAIVFSPVLGRAEPGSAH